MSDYEVIFGLDCVGGDQAPIDCAVVKTNDGKPGIMLDGEIFTKDSLTPAVNKLPLVVAREQVNITTDDLAGLTSVGEYAFYNYEGLKSIDVPNTATSIGARAFSECSGLTSVTIGNGVTSIGNEAFSECSGLTSITIPDSVTSIGNEAFSECSGLTSITIGNGVTSIEDGAFADGDGAPSNLDSFIITAEAPPVLGDVEGLFGCHFKSGEYYQPPCQIYVPSTSVDSYKSADVWSFYSSHIEANPNE